MRESTTEPKEITFDRSYIPWPESQACSRTNLNAAKLITYHQTVEKTKKQRDAAKLMAPLDAQKEFQRLLFHLL
jgi:hypothetical protein